MPKVEMVETLIYAAKEGEEPKTHGRGSVVSLPDDLARSLLARGAAIAPGSRRAAATPAKPTGDALIERLVQIIGGLDPAEDFNPEGKPGLRAIAAVAQFSVTADERDAAFEAFAASQAKKTDA